MAQPTSEKLACALSQAGLHEMAARAREKGVVWPLWRNSESADQGLRAALATAEGRE